MKLEKNKIILITLMVVFISVLVFFASKEDEIVKGEDLPEIKLLSIKQSEERHLSLMIAPPENVSTKLTGWTLASFEKTAEIEEGSYLPRQGQVNKTQVIKINEPTEVIISEKPSPLGVSFKENICTGFLDQYQDFYPPLENNCPSPIDLINVSNKVLEPSCESYVKQMPRCTVLTSELPQELSITCRELIKEHVNYNSCVEKYKNNEGFFLNRWRFFQENLSESLFENNQFKVFNSNGNFVEEFKF